MSKIIVFEKVNYEISERPVLEDINVEIEEGEFVFIIGPTGAGKSTFLKMIYMEIFPTSGKLTVMGFNVLRSGKKQRLKVRRNLGIIFQDLKLLKDRTVFDNVALPLEIDRQGQIAEKVHEVLRNLGILHKASEYIVNLSQGERQKVAIARAIVREPAILIGDEPTAHIYRKEKPEIMTLFRRINAEGTTCIIATHDMNIVEMVPYARRIYIEDGRIYT